MKSKFEWRVNGFDRMGQAGVHSIGMGVLIGLEKEWRTDITMMAYHLRYLQKHYWRTKYSVNFPRMRPSENGGFQPNVVMSDRELAQVTFAMRIFDHDVDISYSTREPAAIRDHMATLGVTTMSAESKMCIRDRCRQGKRRIHRRGVCRDGKIYRCAVCHSGTFGASCLLRRDCRNPVYAPFSLSAQFSAPKPIVLSLIHI